MSDRFYSFNAPKSIPLISSTEAALWGVAGPAPFQCPEEHSSDFIGKMAELRAKQNEGGFNAPKSIPLISSTATGTPVPPEPKWQFQCPEEHSSDFIYGQTGVRLLLKGNVSMPRRAFL